MSVISTNVTTFKKEVTGTSDPVLVKFFSLWDANCRYIEGIYSELAREYPRIRFVESNVDSDPENAEKLAVTKVPTFMFVKDGKILKRMSGLPSKRELKETINLVFR